MDENSKDTRERDKVRAGREAGQIARARFIEALERRKSLDRAVLRLHQGLSAKVVKAKWSPYCGERGGWTYSKPLVDYATRAKYVDLAMRVLDVLPADRLDLEASGDLNINIVRFGDQEDDKSDNDGDDNTAE